MTVDLSALRLLLKINNIHPESSDEEIRVLLEKAQYTPEEITVALTLLKQPIVAPPQVSVSEIKATTPLMRPQSPQHVPETATIPVAQERLGWKVTGIAMSLLLFVFLSAFAIPVVTISVRLMAIAYAPFSSGQIMVFVFFAVAVLFMTTLVWCATRITKFVGVSSFFPLRLAMLWSTLLLLWFGIGSALRFGLTLYSRASVPDWASFGFGLVSGMFISVLSLAFVLMLFVSVIVSWRQLPLAKGRSVIGRSILLLPAILIALYLSNLISYPARALEVRTLCYFVYSYLDRAHCLQEAFVSSAKSGGTEFDVIKVPLKFPHGFMMVGDSFVFTTGTDSGEIYIDGLLLSTEYKPLPGNLVDIGGKLAYIAVKGPERGAEHVLVVDGKVVPTPYKFMSKLSNVQGSLAYVGRNDTEGRLAVGNRTYGAAVGATGVGDYVVSDTGSVAYVYKRAGDKSDYVAIDDRMVDGPYEIVRGLQFSGKQLVFAGTATGNKTSYLWSNGQKSAIDGRVIDVVVASDEVAVRSTNNGREFLTINGNEVSKYERYSSPHVLKGKFIYTGRNGNKTDVVLDGKVIATYDGRSKFFFATEGGSWVLIIENGQSTSTYVDGKRMPGVLRAYTAGPRIIFQKKDGFYLDDDLIAQSISLWNPNLINGKIVVGGFALGDDTYIIAEKGLLSPVVTERLNALEKK